MKTIAVVSQKGGGSKSTLSLCLAHCLAQSYKTCLVDIDPQGSLTNFKELLKVDLVSFDTLKKQTGYDVAIIDTPPYISDKLPLLIKQADYVLITCRPNYFDAVATKSVVALVPKEKPSGIALTQIQHRVNIKDVIEVLESYQIPILKQSMTQRVSYARAMMQSIFESEDIKAQKEILSIVLEIFSAINK